MRKALVVLFGILLACSISSLPMLAPVKLSFAAAGPRIYLEPSAITFYSNTTLVGYRFNVTVWVENVTNLGGVQIYMEFDDSVINVTRWFEPKMDPDYVFYGRGAFALPTPPNDVNYIHIGPNKGQVKVSVSLFPPNPPYFNGSGKICIFELMTNALPPARGGLTSVLHIDASDTFLLDGDGGEVAGVTKEDGSFVFIHVYRSSRIYLDPSANIFYNTTSIGHLFNVTVWVENATNVGGAQIYLEFNDSMINVTRWFEPKNDTQYIFYNKTTLPPDPSYVHLEPGKGRFMVSVSLFLPPPAQPAFTGDGKMCIFEFNITNAAAPLSCILSLHNLTDKGGTYMLDGDGIEILNVVLEDGSYEYNIIPEYTPLVALSMLMASTVVTLLLKRRKPTRKLDV